MIKRLFCPFLFIGVLFIISCGGNDETPSLEFSAPIPDYLEPFIKSQECYDDAIKGIVSFSSWTLPRISDKVEGQLEAYFIDDQGVKINKGPLEFGGLNVAFNSDTDNLYSSKFYADDYSGDEILVKLGDTQNLIFSENIRMPELVVPLNLSSNKLEISGSNQTVTWTSDAANPYGILIAVYYSPNYIPNETFKNNGYADYVTNVAAVEDLGTYTFNSSDFAGIPLGAHLSVYLTRGNCSLIEGEDDGNKYLIVGYNKTEIPTRYSGGF